ncbi:MAG: thermonuclease family protein [Bradyrhizobium sp.]|nr:thermonuclease family protein [Bradyrhizobium sp.]MBU6464759.1 thermonuclease family protein [Pseudomonadota bacterium]MDE2069311.1 thermonuclease family protein [Bradyrhizobium sp.]MDE2243060.1 thermonuclease family protein [Bradyrhizobium sp.]
MFRSVGSRESQRPGFSAIALSILVLAAAAKPANAAGCSLAPQGEGRVTAVIDARTLRLDDGRDVSLVGIEPVAPGSAGASRTAALSAITIGRDITLHGDDDTPDRYGRQPAFVFLAGSDVSVQTMLLTQGDALVAATVTEPDCAATLVAAEASARAAKRGIWANGSVIKNAESPGDISAGIGRFMLVEGRVLSVRQAGATTYLNFGRNWTRDFAVTIPKRMIAAFETAGVLLKSLENQRIRVRGWVEAHGGPRIEVLRVGQIERLGEN